MKPSIHHAAIICSDLDKAKFFYVSALGLKVIAEHYREARNSWKIDLALNDHEQIELFTFPNPPERVNNPEACGLRHLALSVENLDETIAHLNGFKIQAEEIRVDEYTGKRFTFVKDPDNLPIELYEI